MVGVRRAAGDDAGLVELQRALSMKTDDKGGAGDGSHVSDLSAGDLLDGADADVRALDATVARLLVAL